MAEQDSSLRRRLLDGAVMAGAMAAGQVAVIGDFQPVAGMTLLIMTAVSVVAFLRQKRSGFWIGCVVVGWGWLALSLATPLGPRLPGVIMAEEMHARFYEDPRRGGFFDPDGDEIELRYQEHKVSFGMAAKCLLSLAMGLLGGVATHILFASRIQRQNKLLPREGSLLRADWREDREALQQNELLPREGSFLRADWREDREALEPRKKTAVWSGINDFDWP